MNLEQLIEAIGLLGVFGIVFAESGLLVGFFLPGDSLLFTAGFLASGGFFRIEFVVPLIFLASVLGDNLGYYLGHKAGYKIFKSDSSKIFHKDNLDKTKEFFKKYGGLTVIVAKFIPAIRAFAPALAGTGKMPYASFLFFDIIAGLVWSASLTLLGFYLGNTVPNIDRYILPIVGAIIMVSILPGIVSFIASQVKKRKKKPQDEETPVA